MCREDKGADQLRGYRVAGLCLCFRISYIIVNIGILQKCVLNEGQTRSAFYL